MIEINWRYHPFASSDEIARARILAESNAEKYRISMRNPNGAVTNQEHFYFRAEGEEVQATVNWIRTGEGVHPQ